MAEFSSFAQLRSLQTSLDSNLFSLANWLMRTLLICLVVWHVQKHCHFVSGVLGKNIQEFTTTGVSTCLLEMLEKSGKAAPLKNAEGGMIPSPASPQQTVPSKISNSTCGNKRTAVLCTLALWLAEDWAACWHLEKLQKWLFPSLKEGRAGELSGATSVSKEK